jgi:hypothetical protein
MSGSRIVHGSSVRSEEYGFRAGVSLDMVAHSVLREGCANGPINHVFWQVQFPDSLLVVGCGPYVLYKRDRREGKT